MNPYTARNLRLTAFIFCAAVLQAALAWRMAWHGARPDLTLVVSLIAACFLEPNSAASCGFLGGLLSACIAAPPAGAFGSIVVSRTLVVALVGWLEHRMFRDSGAMAVLVALVGTLGAETFFYLFAPQHNIGHWLRNLGGEAVYNTLLAYPLYRLIRCCLGDLRHIEDP